MAKGFTIQCQGCGRMVDFENGDSRFKDGLFLSIISNVEIAIECMKCEELARVKTDG